MTKYRLWAGRLQTIPPEVEFTCYDGERKRLLVLTDKEPAGKFIPVPDNLLGELSDRERTWYNASCFTLMARWMDEHRQDAEETVTAFLDQFEIELKKEAEKGAVEGDGREEGGETVPSRGD